MQNNDSPLPELKPIPKNSSVERGVSQISSQIASQNSSGLLIVKLVEEWSDQAKHKPIPKMLFDEFWYEGEVCILFADTNQGKSILAVQIGNSISRGESIPGFKLEAPAQKVLYLDFELTDKQFEARYSWDFQDHYFTSGSNENFMRAEINPEADLPDGFENFETFLIHSIEKAVVETGVKVLIIDNITYLSNETEKAKNALPLMKQLQALKKKYGLSVLVLAHTPKRDMTKPITKNDIQGSKMISNFCDSCFAIGASAQDSKIRYLKQVKQRQAEERYGMENVVICQIDKPYNFLLFEFIGFGCELQHLRKPTEGEREKQLQEAQKLRSQGYSNVHIGKELGVSESAVRKWFKKAGDNDPPF